MLVKPFYGRTFFDADKGGGGDGGNGDPEGGKPDGDGENSNANPGGQQGEYEFTPITSEAELAGWKANVRKAIAADVRKDIEAEQQRKEAEAERERERESQEAKGEFDKVKVSLESERDEARDELGKAQATVEAYDEIAKAQVEAGRNELPDEALEDFPADAEPLEQLRWLESRKALVAKLVPANGNPNGKPRVPATPTPNGKPDEITDEEKAARNRKFARSF